MPWCPNCRTEYRKGFAACTDCGAPLTDQPPGADNPWQAVDLGKPILLVSLSGTVEADRLQALLDSAGIPSTHKYEGAGQYLSVVGRLPNLGVDLYVPESLLPAARELLESYGVPTGADTDDDLAEPPTGRWSAQSRRDRAWVLVILFAGGTVLSGIALLWQFILLLVDMLLG